MTHIEQQKIILELRDYENKMSRSEHEEFRMFMKRNKDDEDLDEISKKTLLRMYAKYITNKPTKQIKSPFGDVYTPKKSRG